QDLTSVYMDAKASGPKGRTDGERSEGLAAGNPSPALWRGDGATSVKGYERIPKSSGKKITFSMSEIRSAPDAVMLSMAGGRPQAPAGSGAGAIPPAGAGGGTPGGVSSERAPEAIQLYEGVQDVTEVYRSNATPGAGEILRERGYREDVHRAEIADAELLVRELGGFLQLRAERNGQNEKTPDYTWNGKDWGQKTVSGSTSVDNAIRKGAKQIAENPGGIVLNTTESVMKDESLLSAIQKRFKRVALREMDVIIISHGELTRILRLVK
ncbi:MAG: hypothetical protein IJJ45_02905, partial [Clostridia bacterium]|nr:hypothetical protein [Clostridia bacterium]